MGTEDMKGLTNEHNGVDAVELWQARRLGSQLSIGYCLRRKHLNTLGSESILKNLGHHI